VQGARKCPHDFDAVMAELIPDVGEGYIRLQDELAAMFS
jgi:hypothetical protein